jgi:SAM-dependent methyltransferase
MLPSAPTVWIPGPVKSRKERLDTLVQTAREKNQSGSRIPKFLRRFFRKQGGYNRAVLESVDALSRTADDLTRRMGEITTCLGQLNGWLLALHEQSDADANWMKAAAPGVSLTRTLENHLNELEFRATTTSGEIGEARIALAERIQAAEAQSTGQFESVRKTVDQLREDLAENRRGSNDALATAKKLVEQTQGLQGEFGQVGVHLRNLQAQVDELTRRLGNLPSVADSLARHSQHADDMQHQVDKAGLHLRNLQAQTDRLGVHINNLQGFVDKHVDEASVLQNLFDQRVSEVTNDAALVKGELSEYGSLLRHLLAKDSKASPAPKKPGAKGSALGLDSFYFSFENRFRGSRAEIKARVAFYLPFVRKAGAGTARSPVLDLGCGRGEWLELLKEHQLEARGVDLNTAMTAQCKAGGLKVRIGDAVEHLRSLRANSQGAVTGFHIIEHLAFETLMDLFSETRRVLKPGGVAVFESPNCKNLVVGACNFNIDPTHRNPVFPETAEFMLASHGFEKIRIEYLSPVPNPKFDDSTPELATIKDLLYGPQDFGIIAYKPKKR